MISCDCEGCELKSLFFQNISGSEIELICARKTQTSYKKGDIIIREGDEIKQFMYLKEGLVKLFREYDTNKQQIIYFALPLDFISLLSLFSEKYYNYSVTAIEDSTTCSFDLEMIKNIARHNGPFAVNLIGKINKATDRIILDFLEYKQKRLLGRVASILIYFSKSVYKNDTFELPVTRKEIAEYIGMTVENVIRTFSDFRKDNIIKINGQVIEIVDMDRLIRISELN